MLLSTLLALVVSRASLAPIDRISAQLDRISAGEFDLEPVHRGDEFGAVSTKIIGIGKQLRDVREIFSTLRENLDQVMSGLEDGLLLFNAKRLHRAGEPFGGEISGRSAGRTARAARQRDFSRGASDAGRVGHSRRRNWARGKCRGDAGRRLTDRRESG